MLAKLRKKDQEGAIYLMLHFDPCCLEMDHDPALQRRLSGRNYRRLVGG